MTELDREPMSLRPNSIGVIAAHALIHVAVVD